MLLSLVPELLPHLAAGSAYVKFISAEPLLGPLRLDRWLGEHVNWVITGDESGPKAASRLSCMDPRSVVSVHGGREPSASAGSLSETGLGFRWPDTRPARHWIRTDGASMARSPGGPRCWRPRKSWRRSERSARPGAPSGRWHQARHKAIHPPAAGSRQLADPFIIRRENDPPDRFLARLIPCTAWRRCFSRCRSVPYH